MEIKNKLKGGEEHHRGKKGNMYKGPLDKDSGGGVSLGAGVAPGKEEQWGTAVGEGGEWGQL